MQDSIFGSSGAWFHILYQKTPSEAPSLTEHPALPWPLFAPYLSFSLLCLSLGVTLYICFYLYPLFSLTHTIVSFVRSGLCSTHCSKPGAWLTVGSQRIFGDWMKEWCVYHEHTHKGMFDKKVKLEAAWGRGIKNSVFPAYIQSTLNSFDDHTFCSPILLFRKHLLLPIYQR